MHTLRLIWCLCLTILAVLDARAAPAQVSRQGTTLSVVPGLVLQGGNFGDDNPKSAAAVGPTIGALLRLPRSGSTGVVAEATYQFYPLRNPHFPNERSSTYYLQVGAQVGRADYVRPSAGVVMRGGLRYGILGLAIGREYGWRGRYVVAPEFAARLLGSPGFLGLVVGVQVPGAKASSPPAYVRERLRPPRTRFRP